MRARRFFMPQSSELLPFKGNAVHVCGTSRKKFFPSCMSCVSAISSLLGFQASMAFDERWRPRRVRLAARLFAGQLRTPVPRDHTVESAGTRKADFLEVA